MKDYIIYGVTAVAAWVTGFYLGYYVMYPLTHKFLGF